MKEAVKIGYKTDVAKAGLPLTRVSLCRLSSQLATDGCHQAHHQGCEQINSQWRHGKNSCGRKRHSSGQRSKLA
jgi:hypothetical protein